MLFFKGRRVLHYNLQKRRVAHVAPLFLATFAALFFGCAPRSHGEPSGSIFGPNLRPTSMRTIEFFRRCPSTRPAKGRPSVYTALCARIEVRPLRARLENHPKIIYFIKEISQRAFTTKKTSHYQKKSSKYQKISPNTPKCSPNYP